VKGTNGKPFGAFFLGYRSVCRQTEIVKFLKSIDKKIKERRIIIGGKAYEKD
jgi:hypothetical protein